MKYLKEKISDLKITKEKIHSINIYLFLGFNLTLVSVLGFVWINSALSGVYIH